MREILLIFFVAALSAAALIKPQVGLCGYIWFSIMRPDAWAWSSGLPYSMALAVATLAGSLRYLPAVTALFKSPISVLLLVLQIPVLLSAVFAQDPSLCWEPLNLYARVIVMALLVAVLVRTKQQLHTTLLLISVFLGALGARFGLYGILNGGVQFSSGNAGFMSDNNDLALGLAMGVPLCWYSRALVRPVWAKAAFLLMLFGSIAAIIMTHSRGAALSLAAVFALIAVNERRRMAVLLLLLLMAAPSIHLVRQTYLPRLATLEAPEEENSALLRLIYARGAVRMWLDHPFLGVGFGSRNQMLLWHKYMSEATRSEPQVIHNTYLQILVDSGFFALLIYAVLLLGTIIFLQKSAARAKWEHPGMEAYPLALAASLAAFAVGCTFLSRVEFDLAYILLMCAASWQAIQKRLAAEKPAAGPQQPEAAGRPGPIRAASQARWACTAAKTRLLADTGKHSLA